MFLLVLAPAGLAVAQDPPSFAGRLSYVTGNVSFNPAGVSDWVQATVNRPLALGDQVYTDNGARAEIRIPGGAMRLNSTSAFQFLNMSDQTVQARLSEGSMEIRVRRLMGGQNLEIDTPNAAFVISRPGAYRIDTNSDGSQTYVTARDGQGQLTTNGAAFPIYARQEAVITGQGQYQVYAAPGNDDFDNWAMSRDSREDHLQASSYVSPYMVGYEDLDDNGDWRDVPQYGHIWCPRNVAGGWAPYQDGQWAWVDPWGWTWVDNDSWGYAPFHYGRWVQYNGGWGWAQVRLPHRPCTRPRW